MSKTIKKFDFSIIKMAKDDSIPLNPHVEIVLNNWVKNGDGPPIISHHLMSDREIDEFVQQLKHDLDSVAKRAKTALTRAKDETKANITLRQGAER